MAWEERQTVLDGLAAGEDGRLRLVAAYRAEPTDELADAHIYLQSILEDLTREYLDHLEYRAISRCPHTGLVAMYPIDVDGLDGPWWRFEDPVRPIDDLPPTLFALTGAVAVTEPVEPTPFLVKPGPGVPYVLPRLLVDDQAIAVVSSFPIGRHTGYCMAYFASRPLDTFSAAAEWGTDTWTLRYPQGAAVTLAIGEVDSERDYDLAPWLDSGRLRWIAPGDDTLTLRSGAAGCPYVGLDGRRWEVYVEDGSIT